MLGRLAIRRCEGRKFSTILPSGEKVERELSAVEREFVNMKESEFSKLGLYRKKVTNETTLYKLFQLAHPKSKSDYSACVYAINHFYNFGVPITERGFASRWLATAVETSRVDEAVQIVKTWNTWLPTPPDVELINLLIQMVNSDQSRELLKTIRECWQTPLSPDAYSCVIAKELSVVETDEHALSEALAVWRDAVFMDVVLPTNIGAALLEQLRKAGRTDSVEEVQAILVQQSIGGL